MDLTFRLGLNRRWDLRILTSHACGAIALSVPFPGLIADLADGAAGPWEIGFAGAARMLPYVVLSWFVGQVADRWRRDLVVRVGLWLRILLAAGAALAVATDRTWLAIALSTLAVVASLPAYPAIAASLGGQGRGTAWVLEALVTIEVGSFVVGGAIGGLLLRESTRPWIPWIPVILTVLALVLFRAMRLASPRAEDRIPLVRAYRALMTNRSARGAVLVMCAINFVGAFVAMALLPLAQGPWNAGVEGFGTATAVLGFAAFGAPLARLVGGRMPAVTLRRLLPLLALTTVLLVPTRSVHHALPVLALLGALSVGAEAAATRILTGSVPDRVRGTVLAINDAAIVSVAMVATLIAPPVMDRLPILVVFGGCALILVVPLLRRAAAAAPVDDLSVGARQAALSVD